MKVRQDDTLAEFPKAFLDIKAPKRLMLIGINGWPREVLKKMNKLRASEVILADLLEDEQEPFIGHLFEWDCLVLVRGPVIRQEPFVLCKKARFNKVLFLEE